MAAAFCLTTFNLWAILALQLTVGAAYQCRPRQLAAVGAFLFLGYPSAQWDSPTGITGNATPNLFVSLPPVIANANIRQQP